MDLSLHTTIERTDEFGDPVEHEVAVNFEVEMTARGSRQTWMQPAEGPEFEIGFISAEPLDATVKLTTAELATVNAWFDLNHDKAFDAANDNCTWGDAA